MLIRFDRIHERDRHTDRQTDTQTPRDDTGRACIASRDKNRYFRPVSGFIACCQRRDRQMLSTRCRRTVASW